MDAVLERPRFELLRKYRRNRAGVLGFLLFSFIALSVIVGPLITPYGPAEMDMMVSLAKPSWENPLGTDVYGRDMLTRILYGGRISLSLGIITVFIASCIGVPIGIVAGYLGGKVDSILMRSIDGLLAFPEFLLAIIIVSGLGPGIYNAMIAIGIYNIPIFARLSRSCAIRLRSEDFVMASVGFGSTKFQILRSHILPNSLAETVVLMTIRYASTILVAASLGFLGLGAQPPSPEWGSLMAAGRSYFRTAPHVILYPGLVVAATILSLNLMGDALNEVMDPKNR